ncbi:hypothetical protein [Streptomyces sp. MMBL 11-1]|uniref:hypothetical protein n=1 Tax=Streptomyces sp. MMBL 11-1 TaxID=3026420 RepID=UPI0023623312|nr:hypothetical protein [Streptomyces sp. MMBL 11-1]
MAKRFFRVLPGRYPLRKSEVRVQFRERRRIGSVLIDEACVWVDDTDDPKRAVDGVKGAIIRRLARDLAVRDLLGDTPYDEGAR